MSDTHSVSPQNAKANAPKIPPRPPNPSWTKLAAIFPVALAEALVAEAVVEPVAEVLLAAVASVVVVAETEDLDVAAVLKVIAVSVPLIRLLDASAVLLSTLI